MNQLIAQSTARSRLNTLLFGLFGAFAMVLAAVGIYGVANYSVGRARHELGIRMALGAQAGDVLKLALWRTLRWVAAGFAVGLASTVWLTRLVESLLFGVKPGDPDLLFRSIAAAVHSVDPQIALAQPRTLNQVKSLMLADDRFTMSLFAAFAGLALLLAAVGIYGVMAFTVAQREHELGLRMALGASRSRVINLVLKEALMLAMIGLGIGIVGAYFVGRAMQGMLYGVGRLDFGAVAAVALVLLFASLIASWLPARRAAGVEPMRALRTE